MADDIFGEGRPRADSKSGGEEPLVMPRARRAPGSAAPSANPPPAEPNKAERARPEPSIVRPQTEAMPAGPHSAPMDMLLARLPQHDRGTPWVGLIWFIASVVLPILLAIIYYGLIASNQYVTSFHFTVRQPIADGSVSANLSSSGNLSSILGKTASTSSDGDSLDTYTVVDYITSDQAVRDIDHRLNLRGLYGKAGVDPLSRFNPKKPEERLERYWKRMIYAVYDPATGLAEVKVRAFSPTDAYAISTNLIDLSNDIVNSIGRRSRSDSVRFAQLEVDQAQRRINDVRARLKALRAQTGAIDPSKSSVPANVTLGDSLRANLTDYETNYAYLMSQMHNASAPQVVALKAQITATQSQLAAVDSRVSQNKQGQALSNTVGEFEQLDDERQAAEAALFTALGNQTQAVSGADSQRLYMTTYVSPAVPESSTYPKRWASVGLVILISCMIWLVGVLVGRSIMEHGR